MKQDVRTRWDKPVVRLGIWTNIVGIALMFLPGIYMAVRYDSWLGFTAFRNALMACMVYFAINWFIEPLSYYPSIGTVGTYMGWLGGSITSAKIPAAAIAKAELGIEDGTQEAEVVTVYSIYGATISNAVVLSLIAIFGTILLSALPEAVRSALATYVMPSLFGAMLAMFGCALPLLTVPVFVAMIALHLLVQSGTLPIPTAILPLIAVVGAIAYARLLYKKNWIFIGSGRAKQTGK